MTGAETVTEQDAAAPATPLLRVTTPGTTPEEVAAIVAVLHLGGGAAAPEAPRSEWTNPARRLRSTASTHPNPGRGAWRASALPR